MIFKGNASSKAEGGTIKQAFVGVDGTAKEAYKIFVGDESGKAQLVYWNNTPPETAVTVSSLEELYEKATADPYGYFILEKGKYTIPEKTTDTWATIENFYGTLDCSASTLYAGSRLIANHYGTLRNVCFHFSTAETGTGGNLIGNNYGRITHSMFALSQYSNAPAVGTHKKGAVIDNCEAMLGSKQGYGKKSDNTRAPIISKLEQGAVVYGCAISMNTYILKNSDGTAAVQRKLLAESPYAGYKDDPEVGKYVANNYAIISTALHNLESARDYQFPLLKSVYYSSSPCGAKPYFEGLDFTHEWVNYHNMTAWLKDMPTMYSLY